MRGYALAVLLLLAASGCFGGQGGGNGNGDDGPDTGDPDGTNAPPPNPEGDSAVLYVQFNAEAPATVEVPFPAMDSCRTPQDWMAGQAGMSPNTTAELRDAVDGRTGHVLAVSGSGFVSWSKQIDAGPPCQPIRYDPWSIDPDPEDGTIDIRIEGSPRETNVVVRLAREGCIDATYYAGEAFPGWTTFQGLSLQDSCT